MSLEGTVIFWPPVLRGLVDQEPPQGWVFLIILMTAFNNICQLREQPPCAADISVSGTISIHVDNQRKTFKSLCL